MAFLPFPTPSPLPHLTFIYPLAFRQQLRIQWVSFHKHKWISFYERRGLSGLTGVASVMRKSMMVNGSLRPMTIPSVLKMPHADTRG
jgi:hypothetical protein